MSMLNSFVYYLKEAKFNPIKLFHGMLYGATATYLKVLNMLLKINSGTFRNYISETYHNKIMRLDDAIKFISVNKSIEFINLDQIIPYKYAKDIILKNPQNIIACECACRAQKKDPCHPTDVCLVIGEPFADLIRIYQPFRSRKISSEEAVKIIKEEDEKGHIHTALFRKNMLNRFYAICNCCKCCCLGIKNMQEYKMKNIIPSGYRAIIGKKCEGCGECAKHCAFNAIEEVLISNNGRKMQKYNVNAEKCLGCGICESKCEKQNITLIRDIQKGFPLDIEELSKQYK